MSHKKSNTRLKYFGWIFIILISIIATFLYLSIRGLNPATFNPENIVNITIVNGDSTKTINSKDDISAITDLLMASEKTDTYKAKIHTKYKDIFFHLKENKTESIRILYTVDYGILIQSNSFVYKNDSFIRKIDTYK